MNLRACVWSGRVFLCSNRNKLFIPIYLLRYYCVRQNGNCEQNGQRQDYVTNSILEIAGVESCFSLSGQKIESDRMRQIFILERSGDASDFPKENHVQICGLAVLKELEEILRDLLANRG